MIENSKTLTLELMVTRYCNLNCDFCFVKKTSECMDKKIAIKSVEFAFNQAIRNKINTIKIEFVGGEPLLVSDTLLYVIRYSFFLNRTIYNKKFKISFGLTTNGTILNKKIFELFSKNNWPLQVSVSHPLFFYHRTNKKEMLKTVLSNVKKMLKIHPMIRAKFTITRDELKSLYDSYTFYLNKGFKSFAFSLLFNMRKPNYIMEYSAQLKKIFEDVTEKIENGSYIYLHPFSRILLLISFFKKLNYNADNLLFSCGIGQNFFFVDTDGKIYPCINFREFFGEKYKLGNVFNNELNLESLVKLKKEISEIEKLTGVKCICPANFYYYSDNIKTYGRQIEKAEVHMSKIVEKFFYEKLKNNMDYLKWVRENAA